MTLQYHFFEKLGIDHFLEYFKLLIFNRNLWTLLQVTVTRIPFDPFLIENMNQSQKLFDIDFFLKPAG